MLASGLTIALSAAAAAVLPAPLPHSAQAAVSAYRNCLFGAIDEQYRAAAFSERQVVSACASVRRTEFGEAAARLNEAGWPTEASRRRVRQRFDELDESVWTIVGHLKARRAGR